MKTFLKTAQFAIFFHLPKVFLKVYLPMVMDTLDLDLILKDVAKLGI